MDSYSGPAPEFDYLFKLLLIGDSGVGKSSLLLSFTSDTFEDLSPTIGVDFKVKHVTVGGKKLKLAIWDTAGQERFRTLTSSYYRGAQGVIMVYDVTRRETFTNLSDIWAKEIDLYSTNQDCIKMLVGNKVDKESERVVSKKDGIDFAREYGCLFIECSAKTRVNVEQCFEELVLKRRSHLFFRNSLSIHTDIGDTESVGRRFSCHEKKHLQTETSRIQCIHRQLLLNLLCLLRFSFQIICFLLSHSSSLCDRTLA